MKLQYTLPTWAEGLAEIDPEKVRYCVPYDLTAEGRFLQDGFLVVKRERLLVLGDRRVLQDIPLRKGMEIVCSPQVDSGLLLARQDGEEQFLCRFTMRHMVRISYVAKGATQFAAGVDRPVESREREIYCQKCGRVLPGAALCPKCDGGRSIGLRHYWDLCSRYTLPLLVLSLLTGIVAVINVSLQFIQRDFIDNVLQPATGTLADVARFFGIMLVLTLVNITLNITNTLWSTHLGTRISRDLRARIFDKINQLSLSFLNIRQAGELMNRTVEDTNRVRDFMQQTMAQMLTNLFTMAGALILMLIMNWKLALLAVALAPLAMLLVRLFRRKERRIFRQQWLVDDRLNDRLQDVISGIRVVKSFGQEKRETDRFQEAAGRLMRIQRRNEIFWATLYPFITIIMTAGTYFVMYFGGVHVLDGTMTSGQLVQFIAYTGMLYGPLGYISRLPRMLVWLVNSLERIYDILDEEPDIRDSQNSRDHAIAGKVDFQNVSFGYKSYEPVLEGLNLSVKQGEMIGLVGSSGAGKSTVINLLMRLYDVDGGQIRIDGVPLSEITTRSLHSQIGVVLQETFLFSGTVFDNIRYACPDADERRVIEAAKMANAHEFITKLPDGYDTYVGEKGYTLSGGERQRIAIARAILHNPRLLILDEATSSLDTETEYQIQEALGRLIKGRTTFAIAHRLSTLREADRIVVIDKHRVAEVGSHNELMRKKGIYYGLVMAQLDMHRVRK